jgi:hypothetical protein
MASELDQGDENGWEPHTFEGEHSHRMNSGAHNRWEFHRLAPCTGRCPASLSSVANYLLESNFRIESMY